MQFFNFEIKQKNNPITSVEKVYPQLNFKYFYVPTRGEMKKISKEEAKSGLENGEMHRIIIIGNQGKRSFIDRFICPPYHAFQIWDNDIKYINGSNSIEQAVSIAEKYIEKQQNELLV